MIQITHRFQVFNSIPQIVIYAYTPVEYEFATEDSSIKYNALNVANKVREYAQKNFSHINNPTVTLIVNGVIMGSVALTTLLAK